MQYSFVSFLLLLSFYSFGQLEYNLKKSYSVKVYLTERKEIEGIFHSLTDSTILVMDEQSLATTIIPVDSIYKLEFKKFNQAKKTMLLAVSIGFTTGFILGQVEYDQPGVSDSYKLGRSAGGGLLGGFIGALAGAIITKLSKSYLILGNPRIFHQFKNELANYQLSP